MTKKMRKIWAIVTLVAMIISITPLNAFAVDGAGSASVVATLTNGAENAQTTMNLALADDATTTNVVIDFTTSNFTNRIVTGDVIGGFTATEVSGAVVTLTGGTFATNATLSIPVTNPAANAVAQTPTVKFGDETAAIDPGTLAVVAGNATFNWGFKTGALAEKESNSTLSIVATDDNLFNKVVIAFSGNADDFNVVSGATVNGWTTNYSVANQVTLTKTSSVTNATIELPVVNPNDASGVAPTVTLNGEATTTGTATLATTQYYTVTIDPTTVKDKSTATVNATVKHNGSVVSGNAAYVFQNAETTPVTISSGNIANGVLTIPNVAFEKTGTANATYDYTLTIASGDAIKLSTAKVTVLQELTNVTGLDNVVYNDSRLVQGTIKNAAGTAFAGAAVTISGPSLGLGAVYTATTNSAGNFSLTPIFNEAGKWTLNVNGVKYQDIVVAPKTYTVSVTGTATANFANTLTVVVKDGSTVVTNATLSVLKADGTAQAFVATANSADYSLAVTPGAVGSYTVKATRDLGGSAADIDLTGSTTFDATSAAKINVTTTDAAGIAAGAAKNDFAVTVVDATNNGITTTTPAAIDLAKKIKSFTVAVNGVGVSKSIEATADTVKTVTFDGTNAFTPEQAGDLTVTITAKMWDGTTADVVTKTIKVTGYKVAMTLGNLVFGNTFTPAFVVTDATGSVINIGRVEITTTPGNGIQVDANNNGVIDASETATNSYTISGNINNGQYNGKLIKLSDVGSLVVTVYDAAAGGTVQAKFTKTVAGASTYAVTANKAQLLAGFAENVDVTVKDAAGAVVSGLAGNFKVNGATYAATEKATPNQGTYTLANVNAASGTSATDVTISVNSTGNTNTGSVKLTGVAPKVTISGDNKVTDGVEEAKTITIVDPRNADALVSAATINALTIAPKKNASNLDTATLTSVKETVNGVDGADNAGTFAATFKDTYLLKIKAADVLAVTDAAVLVVKVNGVQAATIDVAKAALTADADKLYLGISNKVTLTLKDSHGAAIANQPVGLYGSTDANGKLIVTVTPTASGNLVFDATIAKVTLPIAEPTSDSKLIDADIVKNADGFDVAVQNNGLGADANLKVVVKDEAGKQIGYTYISELKGGAIATAFVKASTTKVITKTVTEKVKVAYSVKITTPYKVKVAYKVKVKGKTVTKYKYVTKYKFTYKTAYKYVDQTKTVNETVDVKGTIELVKGTTVLDSYSF